MDGKCEIGVDCKGKINRCHIVHDGTTPNGADKENIIILCQKHHWAFDHKMKTLLFAPFHNSRETRKAYHREYNREFFPGKYFSIGLEKNIREQTIIRANKNTGHITITSGFTINRGVFVPRLGGT